ncbi:uncharacterized protein LOC124662117 [Lolium rigidum]|uniref:uncharacterized protein LOC124662117 n=1 Tax=Lolium rigidum TaxID=89674 RepID=UPI001F5D981C|nr:uncharacterized protein LOC124662117 [Lolium rigidum]
MDVSSSAVLWRDWSGLGDGPAGLIADHVLAYDVGDCVRFRAVCRAWRRCSADPRAHGGLDRRFHPWQWTMLREVLVAPNRRSFLNTSTGQCIQVDIPELHDHKLLAPTSEGLLVLIHDRKHIRLLNPLTRHLTELPPITTLVARTYHRHLLEQNPNFMTCFAAWGSGFADDSTTFLLCFSRLRMLGMAKPGDDQWTVLQYHSDGITSAPLMFAGRFYCATRDGVVVLDTDPDMPRLKVAPKLKGMCVSPISDTVHLVNNHGELLLVHRRKGPLTPGNKLGRRYDTYRVDLDTGTLVPLKSLGDAGRAIFMGMDCSLSVSLEVFPSGSISADTMYLSFDFSERKLLKVGAYHLADGSVELRCSLVPRPHTLVDCLALNC